MPATLEDARSQIQAGQLSKAQISLAQLLRQDVRNEDAWFLLAQCVTDPDQRQQCLQRVLAINPEHNLARRLSRALQPGHPAEPPQDSPDQPASEIPSNGPTQPTPAGEPFEPRDFEISFRQQWTSGDSFQPRAYELGPDTETGLSASGEPFQPRAFELAQSDPATRLTMNEPRQTPIWVRRVETAAEGHASV